MKKDNEKGLFELKNETPNFELLLKKPIVKEKLPSDFNIEEESEHLISLYESIIKFQDYEFLNFVHAGGQGMVFKCKDKNNNIHALKIVRKKILLNKESQSVNNLSPVSQQELLALSNLSHPNIVHLFNAIENENGVIAIETSFVNNPQPFTNFISETLKKKPRSITPYSPERLNTACKYILEKIIQISKALMYMHNKKYYHFDIKPANILISSENEIFLTDLGSCINTEDIKESKLRVHFTWTYSHPDLRDIISDPSGISGGGLKTSANVKLEDNLEKFDLFALGRTLQEILGIIYKEFGERAFSSYFFKYLHLIACFLLDGYNAPSPDRLNISQFDGHYFISDIALDYPVNFFKAFKIKKTSELIDRLNRSDLKFSWNEDTSELNQWLFNSINTGLSDNVPLSDRVKKVINHPSIRRLKQEFQLGMICEVYPGATHNRWSHTLGVYCGVANYYNALLSDAEQPLLRIIIEPEDIKYALLSALLHDIGQTAFAHDFEAALPDVFNHEKTVEKILDDIFWDVNTLKKVIIENWGNIDWNRISNIFNYEKNILQNTDYFDRDLIIDGLAADIINGPIDADKYDYILRDSKACGVPYGLGFDRNRFVRSITVTVKEKDSHAKLSLSYNSKGCTAIESLLFARYQLYGAVYWHHTFRCLQAMFISAVINSFSEYNNTKKNEYGEINKQIIQELFYHRLICGKPWKTINKIVKSINIPNTLEIPVEVQNDKALEFIWIFANKENRELIYRLSSRLLYKRVFEIKISDLPDNISYDTIKYELELEKKKVKDRQLQEAFINLIIKRMNEKGPIESVSENVAKKRLDEIRSIKIPLVIIDFPLKGIPNEQNFPIEINDAIRKYIGNYRNKYQKHSIFHSIKKLQSDAAPLRVFVAPELHELIIRYLDPIHVEDCVRSVLPMLRNY